MYVSHNFVKNLTEQVIYHMNIVFVYKLSQSEPTWYPEVLAWFSVQHLAFPLCIDEWPPPSVPWINPLSIEDRSLPYAIWTPGHSSASQGGNRYSCVKSIFFFWSSTDTPKCAAKSRTHRRGHTFFVYWNFFSMFCMDHIKASSLDFSMLELWWEVFSIADI